MKIFNKTFKTKKELKRELAAMKEVFPFDLGQTVYDLQLKNSKGRYAKANPSLEYSTISEVTVEEKNYFGLVNRYKKNDVFTEYSAAEEYLKSICTK